MDKERWYLSTWFISALFAFWFLIIPLIIGLILIYRQNAGKLENHLQITTMIKTKEKEWLECQNILEQQKANLEKQLIQKQQEVEEEWIKRQDILKQQEANLEKQLIQKQKEIEEEWAKRQDILKQQEADLEKQLTQKQKEIEEEWAKRQDILKQQEADLEKQLAQKQKEINVIILAQQLRVISTVRAKETELANLEKAIVERKQRLKDVFKRKHKDIEKLNLQIRMLKQNLNKLDDEALYQSFGFYDSKFNLESSEEYLEFLRLVRQKQKDLVKEKRATHHHSSWILNGSSKKGNANNNQNIKLAIRSFNNECDVIISKVKFNNVEVAEKKIRASFYNINSLNRYNSIEITEEYLHLKIEELLLVYEYAQKKQEEIEEQRRINEIIREERKAQKELEEELKKIKKEEQHLLNVISQRSSQISEDEMLQYSNRLNQIREQIENVDYRVKNTKAGYVYIISNIGCFGDNVYKIGMTRRLEPLDRVRELGGASVPFHFDVHAVIFSEDAPALEAALHRTFTHRRVNRINERKEFFKVTLAEIKKVVHEVHNGAIEFKMIAEAKEYRETQMLEKKLAKQHII